MDVKFFGKDAEPEEWANTIRCLGSEPCYNNAIVGRFKIRPWYEKLREFWVPLWPAPSTETDEKTIVAKEAPTARKPVIPPEICPNVDDFGTM
ncbi:unnamed protein product [Haemonchus placei]|uniref:Integrase catalytic domain-containing protein n=1 Tax=Haemonchus placei TaxID=6290 RepID=A0A0N4WV65_HAEPC|nr:unnamed protein product [Haemonchus placei]